MANHVSALKRVRQTERRTAVNRLRKSRMRTQVRKMRRLLAANDTSGAQAALPETYSIVDRAAKAVTAVGYVADVALGPAPRW